jgi:hypothetical protein
MRRLLFIVVVACATVPAVSPAVAHAATPCYKRVIADWTADNVVNGHYSAACLRKAIKKTPEDLRDYSSIIDDINAALLGGVTLKNGTNNGNGSGNGSGPGPGSTPGPATSQQQAKAAQRRAQRAVPRAGTKESIPSSSRRLPLPLLILAGIALAGLLAAAAPPLIKRYRNRFPRPRPTPGSVRHPS